MSYEDLIDSIAEDILQNIPDLFVINNVKKIYENNFTPSTIVLLQELEIFNLLVDKMSVTLQMLRKVSRNNNNNNNNNNEVTRENVGTETGRLSNLRRLCWAKSEWTAFWKTFRCHCTTVKYRRFGRN